MVVVMGGRKIDCYVRMFEEKGVFVYLIFERGVCVMVGFVRYVEYFCKVKGE